MAFKSGPPNYSQSSTASTSTTSTQAVPQTKPPTSQKKPSSSPSAPGAGQNMGQTGDPSAGATAAMDAYNEKKKKTGSPYNAGPNTYGSPGGNVNILEAMVPWIPNSYSGEYYDSPDSFVSNQGFKVMLNEGVSLLRPDIIALTNFEPIFKDISMAGTAGISVSLGKPNASMMDVNQAISKVSTGLFGSLGGFSLTPAGKLLQLQLWGIDLVQQNVIDLVSALEQQPDLQVEIKKKKEEIGIAFGDLQSDIMFLFSLMMGIESFKKSLDARGALEREAALGGGLQGIGSKGEIINTLSPADFFQKRLGFTQKAVEKFTNTKLLMQLVHDLTYIIKYHSYGLFPSAYAARKLHDDPTVIDMSPSDVSAGFKFKPEQLSSPFATITNATDEWYHKNFVASLPKLDDDRVKLLVVTLSKMLRVSAALGNKGGQVTGAAKDFPGIFESGDPFVSILGSVGSSIYETPSASPRSLLSVIQLNPAIKPAGFPANVVVLPFEDRYIAEEGQQAYVPGTSYLVDSVFAQAPAKIDVSQISSFSTLFGESVAKTSEALHKLLSLKGKLNLNASTAFIQARNESLITQLLQDAQAQVNVGSLASSSPDFLFGSDGKPVNTNLSTTGLERRLVMCALAVEAQKDSTLKNLLFRLHMLSGYQAETASPTTVMTNGGQFYKDLKVFSVDELGVAGIDIDAERWKLISMITKKVFKNYYDKKLSSPGNSPTTTQPYSSKPYFVTAASNDMLAETLLSFAGMTNLQDTSLSDSWPRAYNTLLNQLHTKLAVTFDGYFNGRTRYMSYSLTTFAMVLFEIYVSMTSKCMPAFFAKMTNEDTSKLRVVASTDVITANQEALKSTLNDKANPTAGVFGMTPAPNFYEAGSKAYYQTRRVELGSLWSSIAEEDDYIEAIMYMFGRLSIAVQVPGKAIVAKLSSSDSKGALARLNDIGAALGGANMMINRPQIMLAKALFDEIMDRHAHAGGSFDLFYDEDKPPEGMIRALFSFLHEPRFRLSDSTDTHDVRILTVGVPAGFSDYLGRRKVSSKSVSGDTFSSKANDIVSVNVYKKSEQYDGIVYKPMRYLFELTRFVSKSAAIAVNAGEPFSTVLGKLRTRDYSLDTATHAIDSIWQDTMDDMDTNTAYDFLTTSQKTELKRNHATSTMLALYVRYMTGLTLGENAFTIADDVIAQKKEDSKPFIKNLAEKYINSVTGQEVDIEELVGGDIFDPDIILMKPVDDPAAIETVLDIPNVSKSVKTKITQDLKAFSQLFSSRTLVSDASLEVTRILAPKLFERVFNIPVNGNDFEIDVNASDPDSFKMLVAQGIIEEKPTLAAVSPASSIGSQSSQPSIASFAKLLKSNASKKSYYFKPTKTTSGHVSFDRFFVNIETIDGD